MILKDEIRQTKGTECPVGTLPCNEGHGVPLNDSIFQTFDIVEHKERLAGLRWIPVDKMIEELEKLDKSISKNISNHYEWWVIHKEIQYLIDQLKQTEKGKQERR